MRPNRFRPLLLASILSFAAAAGAQTTGAPPPAQPPAQASSPSAAPTAKLNEVIGKVQDFYDRSSSFKAEFKQEYWVKQYNVRKQSTGHVTFAKPGKMDWVYDTPAGNRVVSDGQKLHVYEAANKQEYVQDINASQYPAALSFLTGQGKLTDTFNFDLFDGAQMSFPGGWVLVGTPKTPTPAYQKVFFYVDQATSQVRRVLVLDGQGNHNRFDFVNPTVNPKVTPQQFVFLAPPGTTIIHP